MYRIYGGVVMTMSFESATDIVLFSDLCRQTHQQLKKQGEL